MQLFANLCNEHLSIGYTEERYSIDGQGTKW